MKTKPRHTTHVGADHDRPASRGVGAAALLLVSLLLVACGTNRDVAAPQIATTGPAAASAPSIIWRPVFRGVELTDIQLSAPRPIRMHAARIDLHQPGIRFTIPAPIDTGGDARTNSPEVTSIKCTSFLARQGCQLAVNAAPFEPVVDAEGVPQRVVGLALREGRVYSPAAGTHGVLMLTRDNIATVASPPIDTTNQYTGVGGFTIVVKEGVNTGTGTDLHPRTAAGVNKDGRYLILLVIDGRQPGYSEGASQAETAEWLIRLGAWSGLNLDGGGSTAMAIRGRDGNAALVNRPIHKNVVGNERPTPSFLGVFADPLK